MAYKIRTANSNVHNICDRLSSMSLWNILHCHMLIKVQWHDQYLSTLHSEWPE